jgi:uncharacterized membrane protein YkgB
VDQVYVLQMQKHVQLQVQHLNVMMVITWIHQLKLVQINVMQMQFYVHLQVNHHHVKMDILLVVVLVQNVQLE